MASIRNLIEAAQKDPVGVRELLDKHCSCPEPYTELAAMFFNLGWLRTCLSYGHLSSGNAEALTRAWAGVLDDKVSDWIGSKRRHARI